MFIISLLSPLGKGRGPLLEHTWIPFTQESIVPSLVEIGPVILEKKKMWKVYKNNDDNGQRTNCDQTSSLEPSVPESTSYLHKLNVLETHFSDMIETSIWEIQTKRNVFALSEYISQAWLRFRQTNKKLRYKQIDIFHLSFQCTPSNFIHFTSSIYVTIFAAECLIIKLLIHVYALYYAEF